MDAVALRWLAGTEQLMLMIAKSRIETFLRRRPQGGAAIANRSVPILTVVSGWNAAETTSEGEGSAADRRFAAAQAGVGPAADDGDAGDNSSVVEPDRRCEACDGGPGLVVLAGDAQRPDAAQLLPEPLWIGDGSWARCGEPCVDHGLQYSRLGPGQHCLAHGGCVGGQGLAWSYRGRVTAVGQDRPGSGHTTVEHGEVDGAASDQAQPGQCVDDRRCGWRGAGLRRLCCRPCAGDRRIIEWSGDSPAGPDEVFFAGEKLMVEQLDDKAGHSGLG
jgi:hypothetical protein